jgi:hypothetical protein
LQQHVPLKSRNAVVTRQQEEIAVGPEVDRRADGLLEVGEECDGFLRELDIRCVGELMAKSPGVASGGHRPELRLAFDKDHVRDAVLSQVIRGAGAHAPAADDHDIC